MPKLLSVLAAVCLIAACSPQETEQDKTAKNISPAAPQVPLDGRRNLFFRPQYLNPGMFR